MLRGEFDAPRRQGAVPNLGSRCHRPPIGASSRHLPWGPSPGRQGKRQTLAPAGAQARFALESATQAATSTTLRWPWGVGPSRQIISERVAAAGAGGQVEKADAAWPADMNVQPEDQGAWGPDPAEVAAG